jgi:hypothetical protein
VTASSAARDSKADRARPDARLSDHEPARSRRNLQLAACLLAATALLFIRVVNYGFVNLDDRIYVIENPEMQAGLTFDSIRWALTTFDCSNWHPLTWLSLQLDYELFGLNPGGYHATNLAWHLASTLLLFWSLVRMTGASFRSAVVAGLFAIHPLHVESVAWISERKDVLSTAFWMLTLLAYAYYAARPTLARYILVTIAFVFGLAAKPMLVTLPCVLLLLDFWPLRRWQPQPLGGPSSSPMGPGDAPVFPGRSLRQLAIEKAPLLAISVACSVTTVVAQANYGAMMPVASLPFKYRLANAVDAYLAYLSRTVWPKNLAVFYPHFMEGQLFVPAIIGALILLAMTWWAGRRWRQQPYLIVGWLWYLGTLLPVIGLVQVGSQANADRYTYVPLIGIFLAAVWGVADISAKRRISERLTVALTLMVLATCGACTWVQVGYWRDSVALWEHTVEITRINRQSCDSYGEALLQAGRPADAVPYLQKLTAIAPDYDTGHINLGIALLALGKPEGRQEVEKGLELNPKSAPAHYNLALALATKGELSEAREHLETAVRLAPNSMHAKAALAELLKRQVVPGRQ